MEVDGDVVENQEEAAGKEEVESHADGDGAVLEEPTDDHGSPALEVFHDAEEDDDQAEADKTSNDGTATPGLRLPAPLQR